MKRVLFGLLIVVLVGCTTPTAQPTYDPTAAKSLIRTSEYLDLLAKTPTGAGLANFALVEHITFTWIPFPTPEPGGETPVGEAVQGKTILLASNLLADPTDGKATVGEVFSGASVVGHEITHILMGDPEDVNPPTEAEQRAMLVELKIVCELLAILEQAPVDYWRRDVMEMYAPSISPEPWKLVDQLQDIHPLDPRLAREVLTFPMPPTPTPTAAPAPTQPSQSLMDVLDTLAVLVAQRSH